MKGLRKMPKFLDLGLKVMLSVSMVMGSVPTAALAEVLDEEPQVEEGVVIEEGQVDEGDLAPVDDAAVAEEAVVDEVIPAEDVEPAGEDAPADDAAAEEATVAEEAVVPEEATLPKETAAPDDQKPAEPAPVQEAPATKDEPEGAGIELVAQADDSSFDELAENVPFEVELDESRHWVGKFTAPRDDTFSFFSESMYDTHGCLYADEALTDELDSNTGVEGNSFLITRYLNEGDIVYLKVMQYSYDLDTCVVRVERGIPLRVFGYRATTTLVYDGQPKSPADLEIGNFGYESSGSLTPGVDYELIGWENYNTGEQLTNEPTEIGMYYAIYEGRGDYSGQYRIFYSIVSGNDLSYASIDLHKSTYIATGNSVELDATVYDAAGNELVEGEDFVFEYSYLDEIEVDDGEGYIVDTYWSHVSLDDTPSEPGEYYVRAAATGDEYEGATEWYSFYVNEAYDAYSLNNGSVSTDKNVFEAGQELDFDLVIYSGAGDLLSEDIDYQFKCYTNEAGQELDGEPNEVGTYYAVYKGIEPYTGTISVRFVIIKPVTPVDMALGTVDVEIDSESYWIGIFTASESGDYSFYSEGDHDTAGYLYYDADLSQEIVWDGYSGDGDNFLMTAYLSAGQTVYVKVRNCEWNQIGCSITATKGASLAGLNSSYGQTTFAFDENQHVPTVVFYDSNNNKLVEGTDYYLKRFLSDDGFVLGSSAPTEVGCYYAVYEGIGDYLGTVEVWFEIVDASDLSSANLQTSPWNPKLIDGSVDLVVTVTDAAGKELVEGVHYELSYQTYDDNGELVSVEAPTTPSEYLVRATAIEGGGYTGATSGYWFTVVDPYDIGGDDYSCFFSGSNNKPLIDGTFDLSDLVLRNYVDDTYLILGTDYKIVGFEDNYGAALTNPPTEPGWYRAVVKGTGVYNGVRTCSFRLYNPYSLDEASVSLKGSLRLYNETSYQYEDYYFFEGSPVEPSFSVILANGELASSAYTVTYANNDHVNEAGEYATLTVTGVDPYKGSATVQYKVVDALDLESVVHDGSAYVVLGSQRDYIGWDGAEVEYLATGQAIKPTVEITYYYGGPNNYIAFQPGVDYVCSYEDAAGNLIDAAREIGTYTLVVSGVEGGRLTGTMRIPFSLVKTVELNRYANVDLDYNGSYSQNYYNGYTVNDLAADISDLAWRVWRNGVQLVENLDYAVEYVANAVGDMFDVVFRGIGSYTGTVRAAVYFTKNAQDSLDSRNMVRSTIYGFNSYDWHDSVVYVDSTGVIEAPQVTISGLTQGIDYLVDGVYDKQGAQITTASVGDKVTVKVAGLGAYADATRTFEATVVEGTAATNMNGSMVYLLLQNAWTAYVNGSNQYFMKRGEAPAVYLQVYGRNLLLQEGQGFSVTTALSDDNNTMTVTAVADGSGLVSGSETLTVNLKDAFDLNEILSLNGSLGYVGVNGLDGTVNCQVGSSSAATLSYRGYDFTPSISFMRIQPEYTTTLRKDSRSAGTSVDAITGPGDYTMVVTGTGDWIGSLEVPLHVIDASDEGLALSRCQIGLGDAQLINGKAEPAVTVSYGGTTFTKGTDYTVEYGSNTEPGAHAWVRVTAIEGGRLTGLRSFGFTVADDATTSNLSSNKYSLLIQDPITYHGSTYYQANGNSMRAHALGEEPQVLVIDETTHTPLTSSDYYVTYGNNTTPGGLAYVTVTGKGDYIGSRSANYYVCGTDERPSIENAVVTAQDQIFTGVELNPTATVTLDGTTLVEGTDYTVTYSNAIHAGTATVTVLGKGAYKGAASGTFQIAPYQLTDDAVSGVENQPYLGGDEATLSNLTVTALGKTLVAGTDYEVAYQNNTQAGEAAVTVTGMGDYTGAVTKTFQILGNSMIGATISPIADQTYTGSAIEPAITVTLGDKTLTEGTDYTVSYTDNVNAGTATVTVTGAGDYSDSTQKTFVIAGKPVTVTATDVTRTYGDGDPTFAATVDGLLGDDEIEYTISREPGENVGTYAITPAGEESQGNYAITFVAGELTISPKYLSGTMVGGIDNKTYTGSEVTQDGLIVKDGDTLLVADVDYTVTYGSNVNVGTVWTTVTGMGNYTGSTSTTFQILPKPLDGLQIEGEAKTYTGSALTTTVTVKDGETTLVEGTDFTVVSGSFANNVNAGTGTFTVSGMGNYTGQADGTFTINGKPVTVMANSASKTYGDEDPEFGVSVEGLLAGDEVTYTISRESGEGRGTYAITPTGEEVQSNYVVSFVSGELTIEPKSITGATVAVDAQTYTGSEIKPVLTVKDGDKTLVAGADYEVVYNSNVNVGTAKATVNGIGNYTNSIVDIEFEITPKSIAGLAVTATDRTYTGSALTTTVTIKDGAKTLVAGRDFDINASSYANNVNVGTATVTVTGKGNYTGTATASFKVNAKAIGAATVSAIAAQPWTGKAITPEPAIKDGSRTLTKDVDYTLSYSGNTSPGTATVTVTGRGNYTGTKTATFSITKTISGATVSAIGTQKWTGKAITPAPTVKDGATTLRNGTDYTLSYSNNVNPGTATVTITGRGFYTGAKSVNFRVGPKTGAWKKSSGKWWYEYLDGTYPKSQFADIDGGRYYFDASGWMVTGWRKVGSAWYYFRSDGRMGANDWVQSGNRWCYLGPDGRMVTGWVEVSGKRYYMDGSGYMVTGWRQISGKWYYFEGSGAMARNKWVQSGSRWCYLKADGTMATGWLAVSGKTYWMDASGYMATGWKQISGKYYYFESSGAMARSKWVGNYWLGADGVMATNAWVDGGKYWVGADGAWVKGKTK